MCFGNSSRCLLALWRNISSTGNSRNQWGRLVYWITVLVHPMVSTDVLNPLSFHVWHVIGQTQPRKRMFTCSSLMALSDYSQQWIWNAYIEKKSSNNCWFYCDKGRYDRDIGTKYVVDFQYHALSQGRKVGLGVQLLVAIAMWILLFDQRLQLLQSFALLQCMPILFILILNRSTLTFIHFRWT